MSELQRLNVFRLQIRVTEAHVQRIGNVAEGVQPPGAGPVDATAVSKFERLPFAQVILRAKARKRVQVALLIFFASIVQLRINQRLLHPDARRQINPLKFVAVNRVSSVDLLLIQELVTHRGVGLPLLGAIVIIIKVEVGAKAA